MAVLGRAPDEDVIRMMLKAGEAAGLLRKSMSFRSGVWTFCYRLAPSYDMKLC